MVEIGLQIAHFSQQNVVICLRAGQFFGDLVVPAELALDRGNGFLDVLQDRLALGQRGFLQQDADSRVGIDDRLAVAGLVEARHDLEHRRLTGSVGAHHTDFGPMQERNRDVVKNNFVAMCFADIVHCENVFGHNKQAYRARPNHD